MKLLQAIKKIVKRKIFTWCEGIFFIRKEFRDKYLSEILNQTRQTLRIVNPLQTLNEIQKAILEKKKGAYMRFGDGDVFLLKGGGDSLQKASSEIQREMKEAFSLKEENIFKSLSINSDLYGKEKEMYLGNHLVENDYANHLLINTYPFFIGHKIYSPVCLHYAASYYPEIANAFLKVLKRNCILFIGNEGIEKDKIILLFGDIPHVKTPGINAYSQIDKIEIEAVQILDNKDKFGVVVVAMGCSGRPLMKRIYSHGYQMFLFDFGSLLDGICGKKTRAWLERESIDYDKLLENL